MISESFFENKFDKFDKFDIEEINYTAGAVNITVKSKKN